MKVILGLFLFLGIFGTYSYMKYLGEWGFKKNLDELCTEIQNFELIATDSPDVNAGLLAKLLSEKTYNFKIAEMFREVGKYPKEQERQYIKAYIQRYHPYFECPEFFDITKLRQGK